MLSTHMQRFAAGHEQLEPGTTVQQLRRGGCRSGHLLEVVEDQQYTLISQPTSEFVEQRLIARVAQADRAYDRCEHRCAVAGGGKVDEEGPVVEPVDLVRGSAERQTRLSDATGSGESEQPDRLVFEAFSDFLQLRSPPDES